jgi:P27 family predicted phage terminase small subunit
MGIRGRKPTPVAEKIMTGNPGGRALTTMMPKARKGKPSPSPIVQADERAMRHWNIVLDNTHPDHLVRLDTGLMERYVKCLARCEEAEERMEQVGMVVRAPNTGLPIQSPWLAIINKQTELSRKLASELGITPAMRNRMGAHNDEPDDDPTAHFFN